MLPAPISFLSRRGDRCGYEVTAWRYKEGAAWHVKAERKGHSLRAKAYVVRDGAFHPETASPAEKVAILSLIAQWEAGLADTQPNFLTWPPPTES
jgi:hypothetical protein